MSKSKMTALPFTKESELCSEKLAIVHSDVVCPLRVESLKGAPGVLIVLACLASLSSIIFILRISDFGNTSHVSIAQRKFLTLAGKVYNMIASRSSFMSTFMSVNLSTASKNFAMCSFTYEKYENWQNSEWCGISNRRTIQKFANFWNFDSFPN